jgi:RimJ/RimL family protein N-acetyltransferase
VTFERTTDYALVRAVFTHRTQYGAMTDDFSPAPEDFQVNTDPRIWYVLARENGRVLGVFTLLGQNTVLYEIHWSLLPCAWGRRTVPATTGAIAWMFAHSPARRIIGAIPAYNRLAIKLARRVGMREFGVNPRAFQKHGELHDLVLLGASPEEFTWQA